MRHERSELSEPSVTRERQSDTTSSNQHLQIREAFLVRFRGGRKIKKFVEESDLIPVAFMVMPGCVYSTIQFIFFSLSPYFFLWNYLSFEFRFALYCIRASMFANKVRLCLKISRITEVDCLCSRLQTSFLFVEILCVSIIFLWVGTVYTAKQTFCPIAFEKSFGILSTL